MLKTYNEGRSGGQVVNVITFYSNDLSWNPAEVYQQFLFFKLF